MSRYVAETEWTRAASERDFLAGRYSRRHLLRFDGGVEIAGSSSVHNVPLPCTPIRRRSIPRRRSSRRSRAATC